MGTNQGLSRNATIILAILGVGVFIGISVMLYLGPASTPEVVASGSSTTTPPPTSPLDIRTLAPRPPTEAFAPLLPPAPPPRVAAGGQPTFVPVSLEGTRVSVNVDNQAPRMALRQFGDTVGLQTSMILGGVGGAVQDTAPISLHLTDVPFFEAAFQLARAANFSLYQVDQQRVLWRAIPDGATVGRWFVSGPFAVVLQKIESGANLSQPNGMGVSSPQVFVQLYTEPALKGVGFPDTVLFEQTMDDTGKAVRFATQNRDVTESTISRVNLQTPIMLESPHGRKIPLLKGEAVFSVPARMEIVATPSPTEGVSKSAGELDIEITPLGQTTARVPTNAIGFEVHIKAGRMDITKFSRLVNGQNKFAPTVIADDGSTLVANMYTSAHTQPDEMVMTYYVMNRANGAAPHQVRIEIPVDMHDVPVKFEFKDVLIP